jgi:chaperonin GroES
MPINIEAEINSVNVAEKLKEEDQVKIAHKLCTAIEHDILSREPWMKGNVEYLKMALQVKENKSFPWANSANVKYPLITISALQFQARAFGGIVESKNLVKGKVTGYDPDGTKAEKAERVAKHMTYQLLDKIDNWVEDMDRLLLILPITGSVFKKVFWDSSNARECVDIVLPQDIIINYWAKSLKNARRITHIYDMYHDDIISRQKEGVFLDVEVPLPHMVSRTVDEDKLQKTAPSIPDQEDVPHKIYEVHTKLDLDEDDILEPYIVTIDRDSKTLLRITPNYDTQSIRKNAKGEIVEIKSRDYFVHYRFIPTPDGGLYGVGFGLLLGNLNETASTIINMLLDAGNMATTAGGFISKSIKLKGGHVGFAPNEWKQVSFTGDDLKKSIFPLPVREPSPVLFQLLGFIDQKAGQIISISEISTGKLPGQNTPATTTLTSVEEGLKLFTSIYKRVYESLKKELRILFRLNQENLDDNEYFQVLDSDGTFRGEQVSKQDYSDDVDIIPVADPNAASSTLRLAKAQQLIELIPIGAVDPAAAGQRVLEALDVPKPQELQPKPQQDPKMMAIQAKAEIDQQKAQQDMQGKQQEMQMDFVMKQMELKFKAQELQMKMQGKAQEMRFKEIESMLDMQVSQQQHSQSLQQQSEQAAMDKEVGRDNLALKKEQNNLKRQDMKQSGSNSSGKSNKGRASKLV